MTAGVGRAFHPTALLLAILALAGCSEPQPQARPVGTVRLFLEVMDRSAADPSALEEAYGMLDRGAREALEERAREAASLAGRAYEPWQMLAQGRFRLRFAPDSPGGMQERIDGETAVVVVTGRDPGQRAEIPLVREEGLWRIRLRIPPAGAGHREAGKRSVP
jgi:hypothetical protein